MKRELGLIYCISLVIGNIVGSGIFLLPASLAPYGGFSVVGWLVTAVGSVFLALIFAQLSGAVPKAGGPYAYTQEAYGQFMAFWVAWGYWIALWSGNAALAVAMVSYLSVFFPILDVNNYAACGLSLLIIWVLTFVNSIGVKQAGIVQVITAIIKLVPLIAIATLGFFWMDFESFSFALPNAGPAIAETMDASAIAGWNAETNQWMPVSAMAAIGALTLWSFLGLESATVPAQAVKNPEKTIPRATIIGTLGAALLYIFAMIVALGVVPAEKLATSSAPFADVAGAMWGDWAHTLLAITAVISCVGAINGWIMLTGQLPRAVAQDGLFPAFFAKEGKAGTPVIGMVVSAILMSGLLIIRYSGDDGATSVKVFEFIILLATLSTLVPYTFCSLAPFLMPKHFDLPTIKHKGRNATIAILAFIYSCYMIYGAGQEVVFFGTLLLILGIPVYIWQKKNKQNT